MSVESGALKYRAIAFRNRAVNRLENAKTAHAVSEVGVVIALPALFIAQVMAADASIGLPLMLLFGVSASTNAITTPGALR